MDPITIDHDGSPVTTATALAAYQDSGQLIEVASVVRELQFLMSQATETYRAMGARLLWLKQSTKHGEFTRILSDSLSGMSVSTANKLMLFTTKCNQLPQLSSFADRNYTKAVTLFYGLEDDELKALAEDKLKGVRLTDLDTMSNRQLKETVRKLRDEKDKIVREETRSLERERDRLVEELDHMEGVVKQLRASGPDLTFLHDTTNTVNAAALTISRNIDTLISRLPDSLPPGAVHQLLGSLAGSLSALQAAYDRFQDLDQVVEQVA